GLFCPKSFCLTQVTIGFTIWRWTPCHARCSVLPSNPPLLLKHSWLSETGAQRLHTLALDLWRPAAVRAHVTPAAFGHARDRCRAFPTSWRRLAARAVPAL